MGRIRLAALLIFTPVLAVALVLCIAFRNKPDRYANLTAKKISKAPPKPGQLSIFGEEAT